MVSNKTDNMLGEYTEYGFRLTQPNDTTLALYFKDRLIAVLNKEKMTPEIIQTGCKNFMKSLS